MPQRNVEKLTDRLDTPVLGTGADGLKVALALLWERGEECAGAVPVLVCHDEVVVECDTEQAVAAEAWLGGAMTEGMDAAPMSTTPEAVAQEIVKGLARGAHTVWAPPPLRLVMSVLRHVPRPIFRRLPI